MLKQLFFARLPENVQAILAPMADTSPVDVLASAADKIYAITGAIRSEPFAAVYSPARAAPSYAAANAESPTLLALQRTVYELTLEVKSLKLAFSARSPRPRSRGRSGSFARRHNSPAQDSSLCWYHDRFAGNAKHCIQPCSYVSAGNAREVR